MDYVFLRQEEARWMNFKHKKNQKNGEERKQRLWHRSVSGVPQTHYIFEKNKSEIVKVILLLKYHRIDIENVYRFNYYKFELFESTKPLLKYKIIKRD